MARGSCLLVCCLLSCTGVFAADWPQWMGPNRDGNWTEDKVLTQFPKNGPVKLWSTRVHGGYSGPVVAQGKVYVQDYYRIRGDDMPSPAKRNDLHGKERLACFDIENGLLLWEQSYDCPYKISYPAGPRASPVVHDGKVIALGAMGNFLCCDASTGKIVWQKDLCKDLGAVVPHWGFCCHPLIYKDMVILQVGGKDGLVMAFDIPTGKRVWTGGNTPSGHEGPGYGSPILINVHDKPQIALWSSRELIGIDPNNGKQLWAEHCAPSYGMAIMSPQQHGNMLYIGGIGYAAMTVDLSPSTPTVVWRGGKETGIYAVNATPLIVDGVIYGPDLTGHLRAVELKTGRRLWEKCLPTTSPLSQAQSYATAFLVRNKETFYLFRETGDLAIAHLSSKGYEELDAAKLIEPTGTAFGRKVVWSHPAFAERSIFVRNDQELVRYSLAK